MTQLPYPLKSQLSNTEELEKMEEKYKSSKALLKLIVQTLDDNLERSIKNSDSEKMFEDPNWAYRNAYLAGYREGLRTSRKIIIKE